nr:TraX family protein [Anaerocolumna sedimenticola]
MFFIGGRLLHTRNVKKYLARLGIFAFISEIPYDLAFSNKALHYGYELQQNIFFTLFIGLAVIYFMSIIDSKFAKNVFIRKGLDCLIVISGCTLATILATDYEFMGVLLIVAFYVFRLNKFLLTLAVLLVNISFGLGLQVLAALSMLFIFYYNGKRGPQGNKYIFISFTQHISYCYISSACCLYLIKQLRGCKNPAPPFYVHLTFKGFKAGFYKVIP